VVRGLVARADERAGGLHTATDSHTIHICQLQRGRNLWYARARGSTYAPRTWEPLCGGESPPPDPGGLLVVDPSPGQGGGPRADHVMGDAGIGGKICPLVDRS
jgi:hypothetical protein